MVETRYAPYDCVETAEDVLRAIITPLDYI